MPENTPPPQPSLGEALRFWLRFGCISFGGPAGQIAMMHRFLVDKKRWISNDKFLHALNYCMLLPGPEAQQLATYMGWLLHGTRGGLAAGILFVLPSAFILWALSAAYVTWGSLPMIQAVFEGLKPAVLAIIIGAVIKISKKSCITPLHWIVAVLAFVSIYFLRMPFPVIILGAIAVGIAHYFATKNNATSTKTAQKATDNERSYLINQYSETKGGGFSAARIAKQIAVAAIVWVLPLIVCYCLGGDSFYEKLALFFTQAAFVTFGGAYAVLPYVAQVSVAKFGWLTHNQMLDGLALGETTPGPLIMVLAFVGFMAGYNTFDGSLWAATLGLILTTYYTFIPSFLFIFVGAPIIERTHANPAVKAVLQFATAAITGVILSLCLYFGQAVIAPTPPNILFWPLFWVLISLAALQRFGIGLLTWIAVSAAVGVLKYLIFGG